MDISTKIINKTIKNLLIFIPILLLIFAISSCKTENSKSTYPEVDSLIKLATHYQETNFDSAINYYERAIAIEHEKYSEIYARSNLSILYREKGDLNKLIVNCQELRNTYKSSQNTETAGLACLCESYVFSMQNQLDLRYESLKEALEYFEKEKKYKYIFNTYIEIANIHAQNEELDKATEILEKAEEIINKNDSLFDLNLINANMANIYFNNGKYVKAREFYKKVVNSKDTINDRMYIYSLIFLANVEIITKNIEEATKYINEIESISEYIDTTFLYAVEYMFTKAKYFLLIEDYDKSLECFSISWKRHFSNRNYSNLSSISLGLSEIYKKRNQPTIALEYYVKHKLYEDSLYQQRNTQRLTEIEFKYKYENILQEKAEKVKIKNL